MLCVLDVLDGADLCELACACKELSKACHDDQVWLRLAERLPGSWTYSMSSFENEPPWKYVLRMRFALHGAWKKLLDHRAARFPYLRELGTLVGHSFRPAGGVLPYKMRYGAVCELVQLEAAEAGAPVSAATYRAVAEYIAAHSPNTRSYTPPQHMTVREIYKTCYPGFGAGTGSSGVAPGVLSGGSSTKGGTLGGMIGKGVATMVGKQGDEDQRKRLDTQHEFFSLINH